MEMPDEQRFSIWLSWRNRGDHIGLKSPGVYAIALTDELLAGLPFSWCPQVVYFGMTNSVGGLQARLGQFDAVVAGRKGSHGGAERVRYAHRVYSHLCGQLYIAIAPFKCDPRRKQPEDLRVMGDVASFEYYCRATYAEQFGCEPEFNDHSRSPKRDRRP